MAKIRGVHPNFWTDDDVVELSAHARLLYIGLWNYACDNGHVEDRPRQLKMRILPADDVSVDELLDELTAGGRITRANGWVTVPKLPKHQRIDHRYFLTCDRPDCAKPDRGESRSSGANGSSPAVDPPGTRSGNSVGTSGPRVDGDGDGDGDGEVSEIGKPISSPPREDVERMCAALADAIEANGSKRPAIGKGWRDAARLLVDRDGRTEAQVLWLIDWSQQNSFWRSNILSMPKLREKWDQLRLQSQQDRPQLTAVADPSSKPANPNAWMKRPMGRPTLVDGEFQ